MGRLRTRAIVLVVVVALLPLTILGVLSIERAREELLAKARINNTSLAQRAGDEIVRQVDRFEEILQKLAIPLSPTTHLSPEQASRILRSYRIETRELMALDFVREGGREWATGRVDDTLQERGDEEAVREALGGRSANRGACAQACRLPYELVVDGEVRELGPDAPPELPDDPRQVRSLLTYPCWTPPALSGGILYLRNERRIIGVDLTPLE